MPYRSLVQNDTGAGDELVGSAAENLKLNTGVSKIDRLVKPTAVTHENLISAKDEGASMAFCHLTRISLCKRKRAVGSSLPIGLEDSLDRLFVY
jgi:hypothetical protein